MTNVKALLVSNSVAAQGFNITGEDFMKAQKVVKDPMVIFFEKDYSTPIEIFKIVAHDMDDLTFMYEQKIFYTSSVPEGEVKRCYDAIFFGVNPNYKRKKERKISRIS